MTVSSTPSTPSQERRLDAILAELRRQGLRASASRRIVIRTLLAATTPLPAREIAEGPPGEDVGLDLASVYRNLELLERHGVAHRIRAAGSAALYVLAGGEGEYLTCESCGAALRPAEQLGVRIRRAPRAPRAPS